jgi:hypothetical protein
VLSSPARLPPLNTPEVRLPVTRRVTPPPSPASGCVPPARTSVAPRPDGCVTRALLGVAGGRRAGQALGSAGRLLRAGRLRAAGAERLGCTPSLKRELPVPIPWRGFVSTRRAAEGRRPCLQGLGQQSVGHTLELKNACATGRDIVPRCVKLAGGARVDPARPPSPAPASPGASSSPPRRLLPGSRASGYPLPALLGM